MTLDAQKVLMTRTLEIRHAEASGAAAKSIMTEMSPAGFKFRGRRLVGVTSASLTKREQSLFDLIRHT